VISSFQEIARLLGVSASFFALVVAGVLAGVVLMTQLIARWFEDRDS